MTTQTTTYNAPTISSLLNNLVPVQGADHLSNMAKSIWLQEQLLEAIKAECVNTLFEAIEETIESLPQGKEITTHTLPSGQKIKGERNPRQNAKQSIQRAYKALDRDKKLPANLIGKVLKFQKSKPLFGEKVAPKPIEEKLEALINELLPEKEAFEYVNAILKDYGQRYWARKESIANAQRELDIERVNSDYQLFLSMGMSESTATQATTDKWGEDNVRMAAIG